MKPNTLIFVDFPSDDVEACAAFYGKVFGWSERLDPSGYIMWAGGERVQCGGIAIGEDWGEMSSHWLVYFLVEDVEAAAARIAELGGAVLHGPSEAGGMGKMLVAQDPQGAMFALIRFSGQADEPPGQ